MSHYLLFQLQGALASWGEPAVGEMRHTNTVPSRSALLGLLTAALGICRDEEERLAEFNRHYQFVVRLLNEGSWLSDYHTIQVPKESRKLHPASRKDELTLELDDLQTILSRREYRCDVYYLVAIAMTEGAPHGLGELADALRYPRFPLYLGRKSCPPGLPLAPVCQKGELGVLLRQAEDRLLEDLQPRLGWGEVCYWEGDHQGLLLQQSQFRIDQPLSRRRWQFTSRLQHRGLLVKGG
ncbi:type I-E CRISPR-associated protein Cas5/CasD [Aeromonas caviae]|uniref:type I-E CRISPR-associated protein Cas5/CasD n=1 Tax=Aeromonas caviae TaxID=648 RepID=UPI0038CF328E